MVNGVLAVVSHPDDETFGCGGTLSLHSKRGEHVDVLCLTCNPPEREIEIIDAVKILGAGEPVVFHDRHVESNTAVIRKISDVIVEKKPRVLITHVPFDYHREHRVAYQAVKEAVEWAAHTTTYENPCKVERLLLMEVNTLIPSPHVLVDFSEAADLKWSAVECYSSQLAKFNWDYYQKFNRKKAELRGAQGNVEYAEAFLEETLAKNGPFYETKVTKSLL
jgi:LmbE family N-acetylglucosaminyl deacetylase